MQHNFIPIQHDVETDFNGPEIQIVFSRLRRHYDVAVNCNFDPDKVPEQFKDEGSRLEYNKYDITVFIRLKPAHTCHYIRP